MLDLKTPIFHELMDGNGRGTWDNCIWYGSELEKEWERSDQADFEARHGICGTISDAFKRVPQPVHGANFAGGK